MVSIKKTIRFPKMDKNYCVPIYIGKNHGELRKLIKDLPTKYKRGELGNIKSGSDYLSYLMDLGLEVIKKAKAPNGEALTHDEKKSPDAQVGGITIDQSDLKRLSANYNLPRIDEYYEKKIDGKTTPQLFDLGILSPRTTARILLGAQMQILEITHDMKILAILNQLKSKNDLRKKIKLGRVHDKLVKELAGYTAASYNSPPIKSSTYMGPNGEELNPDDFEEIITTKPQAATITKPIFF